MRYSIIALLSLLFFSHCKREGLGDKLVEVTFPPIDFVVPAGEPGSRLIVIARNAMETRILDVLTREGFTSDDVDLIGGYRARVVSLDGQDFSEIERIEIRTCLVGQPNGCDSFDLLFSQSDLFQRRDEVVNLTPSLRNMKELFLGNDFFRFELVLQPGLITSRNVSARLEWSIAAFRDN